MTPPFRAFRALALVAIVTAQTPAAWAQAFDAVRLYGAAPGQDVGVAGAAVISGPAYPGADRRRTQLLPLLDYQWANGWFAGVSNGVGLNFSTDAASAYGLRVTADFGRKESRDAALRGLGDIPVKPELGAFCNVGAPGGLFATSSVRWGSGEDARGLVLDLGLGWSTSLTPQWRLGLGVAATAANAEHLRAYFGIDANQAARSRYGIYTPKAGMRDVRANASLTFAFDPRTSVTAALSARRLLADASDSPLTRERDAASAVLLFAYGF